MTGNTETSGKTKEEIIKEFNKLSKIPFVPGKGKFFDQHNKSLNNKNFNGGKNGGNGGVYRRKT